MILKTNKKTELILSLIYLSLSLFIFASCTKKSGTEISEKDKWVEMYVQKYLNIAKSEMINSGIPVSVKLAQGILESKSGKSELAIKANNHFGIKCGKKWKGRYYNVKTEEWDKKNQKMIVKKGCFRAYTSAEASFGAHSELLKNKRYQKLFKLDKRDYKNWALGLQKLGYATDPNYAVKIIKIIEKYSLFEFDHE